jgi:hypothetical protein
MSHQGTEFASKKDVLADVLKRDIKQVGRFSAQSTAEEVANVLASDITGKIGEYNAVHIFNVEIRVTDLDTAVIITGASPSGECFSKTAMWLCCINVIQESERKLRV